MIGAPHGRASRLLINDLGCALRRVLDTWLYITAIIATETIDIEGMIRISTIAVELRPKYQNIVATTTPSIGYWKHANLFYLFYRRSNVSH